MHARHITYSQLLHILFPPHLYTISLQTSNHTIRPSPTPRHTRATIVTRYPLILPSPGVTTVSLRRSHRQPAQAAQFTDKIGHTCRRHRIGRSRHTAHRTGARGGDRGRPPGRPRRRPVDDSGRPPARPGRSPPSDAKTPPRVLRFWSRQRGRSWPKYMCVARRTKQRPDSKQGNRKSTPNKRCGNNQGKDIRPLNLINNGSLISMIIEFS